MAQLHKAYTAELQSLAQLAIQAKEKVSEGMARRAVGCQRFPEHQGHHSASRAK